MISYILLAGAAACLAVAVLCDAAPASRVSLWLKRITASRPRTIAQLENHECLTVEELALVEKLVPRLRSVVILSHRVDEPNAALARALLDNFQEGAAYTFFVSPDQAHDEHLTRYQNWFEHIFMAAQGAAPRDTHNSAIQKKEFRDVFSIKRLPLTWNNVPYVFYSFENDSGDLSTIAFRGTEVGVGISDSYDRVGPIEARAIIDLCSAASAEFSPALGDSELDLDDEIPDQKVVPLRRAVGENG
jgi:hypothetical protein